MERDEHNCLTFLTVFISTHTLTWSVTGSVYSYARLSNTISTHTLTWSVTGRGSGNYICRTNFNSHAHVERDSHRIGKRISARRFQLTRSRGAWRAKGQLVIFSINFNSHAHVERDKESFSEWKDYIEFQLTRSRGAWRHFSRLCIRKQVFQLTRSRGAWRSGVILNRYVYRISTHTLTWSVTLPCRTHSSVTAISTHTLTWSVTHWRSGRRRPARFQLTRSRGAWHYMENHINTNMIFQLTRSRGAWPLLDWFMNLGRSFQLTRSRGAWRMYQNLLYTI